VHPGQVELFPQPRHTIRLPLASQERLLDDELRPMALSSRSQEITYLVHQMDEAARDRPVDVAGLIERLGRARPRREVAQNLPLTRHATTTPIPSHLDDVHLLETRGLQQEGTRNWAAMQLARHKMLREGWTAERTVDYLMTWTAEKGNGKSRGQEEITTVAGRRRLKKEYERICRGIERHSRRSCGRGPALALQLLSATDASRILASTTTVPAGRERYWREVFLFHLLGSFRDRVSGNPTSDIVVVRLGLSSAALQRWPNGSNDRYRKHLRWAVRRHFATLIRNYLHSSTVHRARTYEASISIQPSSAAYDVLALKAAADSLSMGSGRIITTRQCEHAVIASERWADGLEERYGQAATKRIQRIVAAVIEAQVRVGAVVTSTSQGDEAA